MSGARPVRLQLSRKRGFNLQALSLATNGLPAVNVARPSKWGNPATIGSYFKIGDPDGHNGLFRMAWCVTSHEYADESFTLVDSRATAVRQFRELADTGFFAQHMAEIAGRNLACFCPLDGSPCHADVLLDLANPDREG